MPRKTAQTKPDEVEPGDSVPIAAPSEPTPAAVDRDLPPVNLWAAVARAQRGIEPVTKDKTAKVKTIKGAEYTYKFASTEDVMTVARDALLAEGVFAQRVRYEVRRGDAGPEVWSTFRLVHAPSGEVEVFDPLPMPIAGFGAADKVLAGALTYAWSYWLRDVMCIPRDDENEPDKRGSDDNARRYDAGQPQGGRSAGPPRETQRTVTKPADKPAGKPVARETTNPDDPEIAEAHAYLIKVVKQLLAEAKALGKSAPDFYAMIGQAAGCQGGKWVPGDAHTLAEYTAAIQRIEAELDDYQAQRQADEAAASAEGEQAPPPDEGQPELSFQREPGVDDPDEVGR